MDEGECLGEPLGVLMRELTSVGGTESSVVVRAPALRLRRVSTVIVLALAAGLQDMVSEPDCSNRVGRVADGEVEESCRGAGRIVEMDAVEAKRVVHTETSDGRLATARDRLGEEVEEEAAASRRQGRQSMYVLLCCVPAGRSRDP